MRKRTIALLAFAGLAVGVVGFFFVAPGVVEAGRNKIEPVGPIISEAGRGFQDTIDLHADTLLWDRDLLGTVARGHVDLTRLRQGGVALQVFASVTNSPAGMNVERNETAQFDMIMPLVIAQRQSPRTWSSTLERALFHAQKLEDAAARSDGRLRVLRSPEDIERLFADRNANAQAECGDPGAGDCLRWPVGGMLALEGLQVLEGEIDNIDRLHAAGYIMAGLAHFIDNPFSGSMHGASRAGLSESGRAAVARMEELGMIVDLAHASPQAIDDVLAMARRPVVSSHGGVRGTCPNNRNLSDEQVRGIAATGGIVGIGYWPTAVCGLTVEAIVRALLHVRDVAGIDHVALGSDFDGAVTVGFDAASVQAIATALIEAGLSPEDIAKIMGGNARRVLSEGIRPL
ncbi:dipeptidase [Pelagibacterium limicola]|uniref:dipeptidase n=1 Tax=Pelagibacterium limicola TaxID=2791022 RepID=UPI0018AFB9A7|nr:dipeptidase [Pelagibacterium limicola]